MADKYYYISVRKDCQVYGGEISYTLPLLIRGIEKAEEKAEELRRVYPDASITLILRGTFDERFIERFGVGIH